MRICSHCIFFFKQKTAYEMLMSDWSSDVCSSDLGTGAGVVPGERHQALLGHGVRELLADRAVDHAVHVVEVLEDEGQVHDVGRRHHLPHRAEVEQIGRASCWERVCQYV